MLFQQTRVYISNVCEWYKAPCILKRIIWFTEGINHNNEYVGKMEIFQTANVCFMEICKVKVSQIDNIPLCRVYLRQSKIFLYWVILRSHRNGEESSPLCTLENVEQRTYNNNVSLQKLTLHQFSTYPRTSISMNYYLYFRFETFLYFRFVWSSITTKGMKW